MRHVWNGLAAGMLAVVVLSGLGCWWRRGSVAHLIPDGYVGPVVIVFDDARGVAPKHNDEDGVVYEIPPDGVLRLNTPTPQDGWYDVNYYYVRPDGTRAELPTGIPHVTDEEVLQVFAGVVGATGGERDERPPARRTWESYVVGVPAERDDWGQLREKAEDRAIGSADPTRVQGE